MVCKHFAEPLWLSFWCLAFPPINFYGGKMCTFWYLFGIFFTGSASNYVGLFFFIFRIWMKNLKKGTNYRVVCGPLKKWEKNFPKYSNLYIFPLYNVEGGNTWHQNQSSNSSLKGLPFILNTLYLSSNYKISFTHRFL